MLELIICGKNRQVRESSRGKNGPSAAVSDVTGNDLASVGSSDLNSGYRTLAGGRNLIVGSNATGRAKPRVAFVVKQGLLLLLPIKIEIERRNRRQQRAGTTSRIFCYHDA